MKVLKKATDLITKIGKDEIQMKITLVAKELIFKEAYDHDMTFYSQLKFMREPEGDTQEFTLPAGEKSIVLEGMTFEKVTEMNLDLDGTCSKIPLRIHFFRKDNDK